MSGQNTCHPASPLSTEGSSHLLSPWPRSLKANPKHLFSSVFFSIIHELFWENKTTFSRVKNLHLNTFCFLTDSQIFFTVGFLIYKDLFINCFALFYKAFKITVHRYY